MIEIKPIFNGWRETDKETARNFVLFLLNNITNIAYKERIDYINKNKIRGITVQELCTEEELRNYQ